VLVTCDDSNAGSIAVIEACGGRLENVVESAAGGLQIRRYWID
jgi:predicted acetyltransferase